MIPRVFCSLVLTGFHLLMSGPLLLDLISPGGLALGEEVLGCDLTSAFPTAALSVAEGAGMSQAEEDLLR